MSQGQLHGRELARWVEAAEGAGVASCVEDLMRRQPEVPRAIERDETAWLVDGGEGSALTRAYAVGLDGPVDAQRWRRWVDFFAARGRDLALEVSPYADPSLLEILHREGFGLRVFKDVLVRHLKPREPLLAPASGMELREVCREDEEEVRRAATVIRQGFAEGAEPTPESIDLFARLILQPQARAFWVWMGGQPVGGGVMAYAQRRVALFAGSTLPQARRRGVQRLLIQGRLEAGRQMGAGLATIQAQPGVATRRNAERLGFCLAYTRVTMCQRWS